MTMRERSDQHGVHARDVFERWGRYVAQAREEQGERTSLQHLLARASSLWVQHEPPELAFVPDAIQDLMHEGRHNTTEEAFLERIERGELVALRRRSDGAVTYRSPGEVEAMTPTERMRYQPYDPLLARALREYALESDLAQHRSAAEE
jgi:hypothetical protein